MNYIQLLAIVITYFQLAIALCVHFSLCSDETWQKDIYLTLPIVTGIIAHNESKIILEELHKLWKYHTNHLKEVST